MLISAASLAIGGMVFARQPSKADSFQKAMARISGDWTGTLRVWNRRDQSSETILLNGTINLERKFDEYRLRMAFQLPDGTNKLNQVIPFSVNDRHQIQVENDAFESLDLEAFGRSESPGFELKSIQDERSVKFLLTGDSLRIQNMDSENRMGGLLLLKKVGR